MGVTPGWLDPAGSYILDSGGGDDGGGPPGIDQGPVGPDGLTSGQRGLLDKLSIAGYTPEGSDTRLFENQYWELMGKAQRHGLDVSGVDDRFGSLQEVLSAMPAGASGRRQRVSEAIQVQELEREKALRDQSITAAQESLDKFNKDNNYETLLDSIRNLPATLSDEDVSNIKRINVQRARDDELARLQRVGATIGLRGMAGGGAFASLAEQAARSADSQISQAFNQINMEKMQKDRSDQIETTLLEAGVLQKRQQARLQLEQNLRAAREGFMTVTQPLQDYSAYLEAVKGRELEADLARDQMRTDLYAAGIGAGGSIIGGAGSFI